jgi:guanosine-3',5'-bis(diphosphate) 3'-pyrophosphohydrolase
MRTFTGWHTWGEAEPGLRERLPEATVGQLHRAVRFALDYHGDQRRPTGAPYLEHLLEALEVLVRGAGVTDAEVLSAAILHDVVEDTACTPADLTAAFGARVAEFVGWVTIPPAAAGEDKAAVKDTALQRLRHAPRGAVLVKLADRASNVQTLRNLPLAKQRSYYAQTLRHIVPLAAAEPWFADWYAAWQRDYADLGQAP